MAAWMKFLTCLWLANSVILSSAEDGMQYLTRCCIKGLRKADRHNTLSVCEKDDLDRRSMSADEKKICRHSERVCCIKQIQQRMCSLGKYRAMSGKTCHQRLPHAGGDHFRECCDCCYLGRKARLAKADCNDIFLSFPCGSIYKECCEAESFNGTTPRPFKTFTTEVNIPKTCAPVKIPTTVPTTVGSLTTRSKHITRLPYPTRSTKCGVGVCEQLCEDSSGGALCYCRDGFMLEQDGRSCVDLDECMMGIYVCPSDQTCVNNRGSYRCVQSSGQIPCNQAGYRNDSSGNCVDINECDEPKSCGVSQTCLNTPGSYSCVCGVGYVARSDKCVDVDECSNGNSRCSANQVCVNTVGAYECRKALACPQGQVPGTSGCKDIDECRNGTDNCKQGERCINTIGSFRCEAVPVINICNSASCGSGYNCIDKGNTYTCEDINECSRRVCGRGTRCINTVGSYRCEDINECAFSGRQVCRIGLRCINTVGSFRCEDINECAFSGRRVCRSGTRCINTVGSFRCEVINPDPCTGVTCPRGHSCVPQKGRSPAYRCEDINECTNGQARCDAGKRCINVAGGYRCAATDVCANARCPAGHQCVRRRNRAVCQDIDECRTGRARCARGQQCINSLGSYRCACPGGFTLQNGRCIDVDECSTGRARCLSNQVCTNTQGSYRCNYPPCRSGRERRNGVCVDIDECRIGRARCPRGQLCVNTDGSYRCVNPTCPRGYIRRNGRCADIDECRTGQARCRSGQLCRNTDGSYRCYYPPCPSGQQRKNGVCVSTSKNICDEVKCPVGTKCRATAQNSWSCDTIRKNICSKVKCPTGTKCRATSHRSWSCDIVDICAYVSELKRCRPDEICIPKGSNHYQCRAKSVCDGIRCPSGYTCVEENNRPKCEANSVVACRNVRCSRGLRCQNGKCEDINECTENPSLCKPGGECTNYRGSYFCKCLPGYRLENSNVCRDVNECNEGVCAQRCQNKPGSFECSCHRGFILGRNKRSCNDINECQSPNMCDHTCQNIQGSYMCRCRPGYELGSDKKSCNDINECSPRHEGRYCAFQCENRAGSYRCTCPRGYTLGRDGFNCLDKNECAENRNICGSSDCVNVYGGYRCIPFRCPSNDYQKTSPTKCERRCKSDDARCFKLVDRAIGYWTFPLRNKAARGSVRFTYTIITRGYAKQVQIRYFFRRGNERRHFGITVDRNVAKVTNTVELTGPRNYELEFVGEVRENGVVTSQYINKLYVFVSQYDF